MGKTSSETSPFACIHCGNEYDTLEGSWEHEEENDGHKVWRKMDA